MVWRTHLRSLARGAAASCFSSTASAPTVTRAKVCSKRGEEKSIHDFGKEGNGNVFEQRCERAAAIRAKYAHSVARGNQWQSSVGKQTGPYGTAAAVVSGTHNEVGHVARSGRDV